MRETLPVNRIVHFARNENWITIKGTRVRIDDDGNLMGEIGKKIQGTERAGAVADTSKHLQKEILLDRMNDNQKDAFQNFLYGQYEERDADPSCVKVSEFIEENPDLQYSGDALYRGVSATPELLEAIVVAEATGGTIDQAGVSSWTTDESVADDYCMVARGSTGGTEVMFIDRTSGTRSAMSVQNISPHGDEEAEVVYSRNAQFRVTSFEPTDYTFRGKTYRRYIVEVEQQR